MMIMIILTIMIIVIIIIIIMIVRLIIVSITTRSSGDPQPNKKRYDTINITSRNSTITLLWRYGIRQVYHKVAYAVNVNITYHRRTVHLLYYDLHIL